MKAATAYVSSTRKVFLAAGKQTINNYVHGLLICINNNVKNQKLVVSDSRKSLLERNLHSSQYCTDDVR